MGLSASSCSWEHWWIEFYEAREAGRGKGEGYAEIQTLCLTRPPSLFPLPERPTASSAAVPYAQSPWPIDRPRSFSRSPEHRGHRTPYGSSRCWRTITCPPGSWSPHTVGGCSPKNVE